MAELDALLGPPPEPGAVPDEPGLAEAIPGGIGPRVRAFDQAVDRAFDRLRGQLVADRTFYAASALADHSLCWHLWAATRGLRADSLAVPAVLSGLLGLESAVVNLGVKRVVCRTRPTWAGTGPRPHRLRQPRTSSFPSGHASSAFFAASLLGRGHRTEPLWWIGAALVAASRVHVKIHHPSDVIAGAAVGLGLAAVARPVAARVPGLLAGNAG